jgi:hypothetical protein
MTRDNGTLSFLVDAAFFVDTEAHDAGSDGHCDGAA